MLQTKTFTAFSTWIARVTGKPWTFALSVLVVFVWAVTGPYFGFSDTWQLIINTGATIVTFLMVFLIQNTQNRDGAAIQAKLDELVRATAAHNRYIGIERLTEMELEDLRLRCASRAQTDELRKVNGAADEVEEDADEKAARAADRVARPLH